MKAWSVESLYIFKKRSARVLRYPSVERRGSTHEARDIFVAPNFLDTRLQPWESQPSEHHPVATIIAAVGRGRPYYNFTTTTRSEQFTCIPAH